MAKNKIYTKEEVFAVVNDLMTEERINCEIFCEKNSPAANEQRRRDRELVFGTLTNVLFKLSIIEF